MRRREQVGVGVQARHLATPAERWEAWREWLEAADLDPGRRVRELLQHAPLPDALLEELLQAATERAYVTAPFAPAALSTPPQSLSRSTLLARLRLLRRTEEDARWQCQQLQSLLAEWLFQRQRLLSVLRRIQTCKDEAFHRWQRELEGALFDPS